ncbi:MAG: aspartate 1-decarboxylase [Actinobacteria bacterium]|nr:aspartate 1-decarboxylase [Actinomycetota bacterium]|tara:strand:+ start:29 stop:367 length:339 start_codon:yes stop_codon:yes gene_type:complete
MILTVLKSKLAYVKVTQTELFYEGSITIDEDWMDQANLIENEQVHVVNTNNGERLVTYVIKGTRGSRQICLNGPAARKGEVGDELVIISYVQVRQDELPLIPVVVQMKEDQG